MPIQSQTFFTNKAILSSYMVIRIGRRDMNIRLAVIRAYAGYCRIGTRSVATSHTLTARGTQQFSAPRSRCLLQTYAALQIRANIVDTFQTDCYTQQTVGNTRRIAFCLTHARVRGRRRMGNRRFGVTQIGGN